MQDDDNGSSGLLAAIAATQVSDGERCSREREKNRKAQARFRERQKFKNGEVERRMGELQTAVQNLQLERDALQAKADMLERALLHVDRSRSASLAVSGGLQLQAKFQHLVRFYKNGIQELGSLLVQYQLRRDSEAAEATAQRWQQLVAEALVMYEDEALRVMAYSRPLIDEGEKQPAVLDKPSWRVITSGLHLTAQQKRRCQEVRDKYIATMTDIMNQRKQLNGGMQDLTPPDLTTNTQLACHAASARDSMKALHHNLRQEQILQTDLSYELFMRVLTPIQAASVTVATVPWMPDKLAILEAVTEPDSAT